ncbi:aldehyde dehydrogenase [Mycobacterium intracellulare subsp. chimaera]|uniref:Aldehyde dehydrogenase n=2 Tax=Mycobacterium intracellulare TaxID=1767 RepID=A0A220XZS6_MYCIT|nr:aldehyde dehydrogenase [Mycobacterium intracellulare subsp. chimaera]ASL16927.1 aldehyde dehydrogenase [Mycobacterium intracellulare subsp. chimaera]ASL22974.1 aldehyde dehydrogenase [Mycobacterium intracellulare subsp. chimaera]
MNIVEKQLFIDGQFRAADRVAPVIEAATESLLGTGASATERDIDDAVVAAQHALPDWKNTKTADRTQVLNRLAEALEARGEYTSELSTRETGTPVVFSRIANGFVPAAIFRYYAGLIGTIDIEEPRPSLVGHTIVRREPIGVVAAIAPWNVPQLLAAMKLAPALAAGCTVVFKPAPEAALDAMVFGEAAAEAGLPPGVLNVVAGDRKAGAYLVQHPGIDKVAFTGSTQAGRLVAEACGRLIRPVTLELGGKSAAILLDDVDLEFTMRGLRTVSFGNNGQMCHASTRILVPRSRYDETVDALAEMADSLVVGNPLDETVDVGPLVSSRQRERVLRYIETGKAEGARIVAGGGIPDRCRRGWYVAPTVFADVDNSARIAREEIFGPVLSVIPYETDNEAIDIANDSDFGLAGSVWSSDETRATEIARAVQTGTIGINHYEPDVGAPFGGIKASGVGRELGPEGLAAYQSIRSIFGGAVTPTAANR